MSVITANTQIKVNVPYGGPNGKVSGGFVQRELPASVLGLPTNTQPAPVFPSTKLAEIHANQALSATQRKSQADAIIAEFKTLNDQYIATGGINQIDLVPGAVVNYLVSHEGFTSNPSEEAPFISPTDLTATFIGDNVILVTGNAVWG